MKVVFPEDLRTHCFFASITTKPKFAPAGPAGTPYSLVTPPHSPPSSRILPAPSSRTLRVDDALAACLRPYSVCLKPLNMSTRSCRMYSLRPSCLLSSFAPTSGFYSVLNKHTQHASMVISIIFLRQIEVRLSDPAPCFTFLLPARVCILAARCAERFPDSQHCAHS